MNNEYYGVASTPTEDFLAHYGIRGMKWGVRKAIARGSDYQLSKQYKKAQKKLNKLKNKANTSVLYKKANTLDKVSDKSRIAGRIGLGAAAVGTGGNYLSKAMTSGIMKRYNDTRVAINNGYNKSADPDVIAWRGREHAKNEMNANAAHNVNSKFREASRYVQAGGAGLAALGYGTAVASRLRANALRKKANNKIEMAKAKQKAADFQREMNKAFSGTKYANKNSAKKKKRG